MQADVKADDLGTVMCVWLRYCFGRQIHLDVL